MESPHLKNRQYYIDLYDRHTVERCREIEKPRDDKDRKVNKDENFNEKEYAGVKQMVDKLYMYFVTGERYINKEKTINQWMDEDRKKDELYESARAPEDIRCLTCRNRVTSTFKTFWTESGKEDRILFMYDCPNRCVPRQAFFSDGEEWRVKPHLCLHCNTPLTHTEEIDEKKVVNTYTCQKCGYVEKDAYIRPQKKEEEIDENFAQDRDRFCMTEKDGADYADGKWQLEELGKLMDKWKEEEKARAEKLKQNPKGFHLEGAGYTCYICGDRTPEGDNWYDEWGIKCLICQKAIDENEIPANLAKDKENWYAKYDIQSRFNVKAPTLRKWIRDGILKVRTVSRYGKGVHMELFLIEDNKDFLPPKKLVEEKWVTERKDGEVHNHTEPWYNFVDPHEHLKGYRIMEYFKVVLKEDGQSVPDVAKE